MSKSAIAQGSKVTLHFSLALPDGAIIDTNYDKSPATFVIGDGSMLPGFEEVLMGMSAGQSARVLLSSEQGFGNINPENIQVFSNAKFTHVLNGSNEPVQPGSMLSFTDGGGHDIPGVVRELNSETITVDFNHPLAGREILFSTLIISVLHANTQAVEIK